MLDPRPPMSLPMNTLRASLLLSGLLVATTALAAEASANWDDKCASCHGPDGRADTKMGKKLKIRDMTDATFQATFADEDAVKAVKEGIKDKNGKPIEGLTDEEIQALVARVRSLKK